MQVDSKSNSLTIKYTNRTHIYTNCTYIQYTSTTSIMPTQAYGANHTFNPLKMLPEAWAINTIKTWGSNTNLFLQGCRGQETFCHIPSIPGILDPPYWGTMVDSRVKTSTGPKSPLSSTYPRFILTPQHLQMEVILETNSTRSDGYTTKG